MTVEIGDGKGNPGCTDETSDLDGITELLRGGDHSLSEAPVPNHQEFRARIP